MPTYSFLDVNIGFAGPTGAFVIDSDGGTAEEGVTLTRTEDKNTMTIGAGGDVMHSLHASKAAMLTVRLLKTSPINALLSAAYALQTSSSALHGQNVATVRNKVSGDISTCQFVAFKKYPDLTYAKDGNVQEWTFDVGKCDSFLGEY